LFHMPMSSPMMKTMFGLLVSAACAAVAMNATHRATAHCLSMFVFGFIVVSCCSCVRLLVAAGLDLGRFGWIERRYRVLGMLEIRHQVVRRAARESLDARILHDRSVEINDHGIDQRQDPAVVLACILTRRGLLHAR